MANKHEHKTFPTMYMEDIDISEELEKADPIFWYENIIFVNRNFIDLGIGITGAIFLSQAIDWASQTENGWFCKTLKDWRQRTGMKRRQIENARKKLCDLGILHKKKVGFPAKIYCSVDHGRLEELLDKLNNQ